MDGGNTYSMDYLCDNCSHRWVQHLPRGERAGVCSCPCCGCFTGHALRGATERIVKHVHELDDDWNWSRPKPFRRRELPQYWCDVTSAGISLNWAQGVAGG